MGHALTTIFAPGAMHQLGQVLNTIRSDSLVLVVDPAALQNSGAERALEDALRGRRCVRFEDFAPNPQMEAVERGVRLFQDHAPEALVALGGGSALDMAKLIGACAVQPREPRAYATAQCNLQEHPRPLIAIPTTAGTGAEATHFAVVYVDGKKHSLAHPWVRPSHALVDPALTYQLPPPLTAASGLDALSQAMESIWSVRAQDSSLRHAEEALDLAWNHLEEAVLNPSPQHRLAMMRAAHLAGCAINQTTTTAPHALSYHISTHYGIPHGAAVALTLGAFLEYNAAVEESTCADPRGSESVRQRIQRIFSILGAEDARDARDKLRRLIGSIGCPSTLAAAGIASSEFPTLIAAANPERLSNNPRKVNAQELLLLFESERHEKTVR